MTALTGGEATPVLRLTDVLVERSKRRVLQIHELIVPAGMVLGIIGPNGAGKSTLLQVSGLLESPSNGKVEIEGLQATRRNVTNLRRKTAMVFQDPLLFNRSVLANAASGPTFHGVRKEEAERRAHAWLDRFGVDHLAERNARQLSGGEAQRVNLARAFAVEPALLLMDEPFVGLDRPSKKRLLPDLAVQMHLSRVAALVVSHEPEDLAEVCSHLAVVDEGVIVQMGMFAEVMLRPATERIADILGLDTDMPEDAGKRSIDIGYSIRQPYDESLR